MSLSRKNQAAILQKLGIEQLNPMQEEAHLAIHSSGNIILYSPTGSGKTLAFLLPLIALLDESINGIQSLILVPSRELALQIEQVIREMGSGYKANAIYGGRSGQKDKIDLQHPPAILIATPGRLADRIRRDALDLDAVKTLVLDEFDKSLEIGFEEDMKAIIGYMSGLKKRILTSATKMKEVPSFVRLNNPNVIDYSDQPIAKLKILGIDYASDEKLEGLVDLLEHLGNQPGIVFCNFKDSIQKVSDYLYKRGIKHGCFYGGMEQQDRERSLIKFRNGSHQLIIATDLAARGLDIPELKFIVHFELPHRIEEFQHRNGRTARMNADGSAFVLYTKNEKAKDYIRALNLESIASMELEKNASKSKEWLTLFISGGRKDKISKGDIAGLFIKKGGLKMEELGLIELKLDCAFVSVPKHLANDLIQKVDQQRLKKKKVRVKEV